MPYMWAESSLYWYRGVLVARAKGGDLYTAPELQPALAEDGSIPFGRERGAKLEAMDIAAMCAANAELMGVIEDATAKRIVGIYEKYKDKLDIFHVACSGGKDSAVMLDLVRRALPRGSFVVIFGDTGMEFPDTYTAIEETRRECEAEGIAFYTARSHFDPQESWAMFGPPSRTLRWCCSVHKSTPQTLKLREITGKNTYTGLDFVGIRGPESLTRSTYEYENYGKKQKGQHSYYPLLEWTSAELWLYIFEHNLYINQAYIKGCSRAGCLLCPMSSGHSNFIRRYNYTKEVDAYIDIVKRMNCWDSDNEDKLRSYVTSDGWICRTSGRGLLGNEQRYKEVIANGIITMEITNPTSNWTEWLKTADLEAVPLAIKEDTNGITFTMSSADVKANPTTGKTIRQSLKKAAYCVGCRVCETNCKGGHIEFENGYVKITDCVHCLECHNIPSGCLAYNSLRIVQGEKKMKVVNTFDDHAPKNEWLVSFFDLQDKFFTEHSLGPNMFHLFKRFLRDAGLIVGNKCTDFSALIKTIGWNTDTALGLMLSNLAYDNPQFEWYIKNMDINTPYENKLLKEQLLACDMKEKAANCVVKAFKRIVATPFGTVLNFGCVTENDELVRTKCRVNDNRVLLYALYKFVEKCNIYRELTMSFLYEDEGDRDGISPVRIFGLYDREELKSMLLGLSAAYPDFINAAFTNDMQSIMLRDKSSADVLALFREDE